MKKRVGIVVLAIVLFLTLAFMAVAVDKSDAVTGVSVTSGTSSKFTSTAAGSRGAQGGNVTFVNVTTTRSTVKWAGFLGRVSSALRLGLGSDYLFDFGDAPTNQTKTVFAASDSAFDFSNLANTTAANVDGAWGFPTGHIDSAQSTYAGQDTIAQVSNVKTLALRAFNNLTGVSNFSALITYRSGLFSDGGAATEETSYAFGVSVNASQRDFRNDSQVDYELVVPVNTSGLGGVQTYFFFLDVE